SFWNSNGLPIAGGAPGAAATVTRASTGALGQNNPSDQLFIAQLETILSNNAAIVVADRLAHSSGLSGTVA
ncbi:MAG: hypothetical protein AAB131_14890, partial [Actinomycetota bacterium]